MVMVANVQSSSSDRNDPSPGRPSHHRDTKQTKIFWKERMSRKFFSWWTQKANQSAVLDKYISDNEDGLILMDEREDCDGISW